MRGGKARKDKATYCGLHKGKHQHGSRRAKIRYRSLKDAKGARSSLIDKTGLTIRIYGCPDCKGYHLTSEPAYEYGNQRTVWQPPDRAISSDKESGSTEERQDE